MPPTATRYVYSVGYSFQIPHGDTSKTVVFNTYLAKQKEESEELEYVNPDTVIAIPAGGNGAQHTQSWLEIQRPSPANGTVALTAKIPSASVGVTTIVFNISMLYWHSIIGSDHTP